MINAKAKALGPKVVTPKSRTAIEADRIDNEATWWKTTVPEGPYILPLWNQFPKTIPITIFGA